MRMLEWLFTTHTNFEEVFMYYDWKPVLENKVGSQTGATMLRHESRYMNPWSSTNALHLSQRVDSLAQLLELLISDLVVLCFNPAGVESFSDVPYSLFLYSQSNEIMVRNTHQFQGTHNENVEP